MKYGIWLKCSLFRIVGIVEQTSQSDAAMSELRMPGKRASWQVRGGVIGREQSQGVEEGDDVPLRRETGVGEIGARKDGLTPVAHDHVFQRHAPAVVTVWPCAGHSPQRRGEEQDPGRAIIIEFVEVRTKVMALDRFDLM